jgi:hypothetical protein
MLRSVLFSGLFFASFLLLASCAAGSIQQADARDRQAVFEAAWNDYAESEEAYLTLLANLERYPKEEYLLDQKKILRKELELKRSVMLQSRAEFDDAVRLWDTYTVELKDKPPDSVYTGPTSPGHLWEPNNSLNNSSF